MKTLFLLFFCVSVFAAPSLTCEDALTQSTRFGFSGSSSSKSDYLSIDLPFAPTEKLRKEVEALIGKKLKNRGEAHVTVINPIELGVLSSALSKKEILAAVGDLAKAELKPLCVGKGEANVDGKIESTYFIVLTAPALLAAREAVANVATAKGGGNLHFEATNFFPHITLGFTKRDLHDSDGVIKDAKTCVYKLD